MTRAKFIVYFNKKNKVLPKKEGFFTANEFWFCC